MSQKRPYRLGKRQASVDNTRRRILLAAVAEYATNGIDDTTMLAVARRANVASGTVLYHYPEPEALTDAVVTMWIEEADLPDAPQVSDDLPLAERVDLLVRTMFAMNDPEHPAAAIYLSNPHHPAMMKLQRFWDERLDEVISTTLGPHLKQSDKPVITAIIGGQFLSILTRRGIQGIELSQTLSRLISAWLTTQPTTPKAPSDSDP